MNEWDLLSPRYFSDLFVWLFDGGLPAMLAVGGLLFFGTLTVPGYVKGRQFLRLPRIGIDKGNDKSANARIRTHLPLDDTPEFFPENRSNFKWFYWLSLVLSLLYFGAHLFIARSPATILTTGVRLQWLPADDVRSLVQFLYHWVLTGYALAVLSVALGLDYIARWMEKVLPSPLLKVEIAAISPEVVSPDLLKVEVAAISPEVKIISPSFHLMTRTLVTRTVQGQEGQHSNRVVEEMLLWDTSRNVYISEQAYIGYDPEDGTPLPGKALLRFAAEGGQWYVAPAAEREATTTAQQETSATEQAETLVFQIANERTLLTEKMLLDNGEVVLTWERQLEKNTNETIIYYCYCVPYFKA